VDVVYPGLPNPFLPAPAVTPGPEVRGKFSVTLEIDPRFVSRDSIKILPQHLKKLKAAAKKKGQRFNAKKVRVSSEVTFTVRPVRGVAGIFPAAKSPIVRERTRRNRVTIRGLAAGRYAASYKVQIIANDIVLGATEESPVSNFTLQSK
jgi:hypothetical protein